MVTPNQQRVAADYLSEEYGVSQRRIGRVLGRSRSSLRYRRRDRADETPLLREIRRLARRHPRSGYRRVHAVLFRRGWSVNLKRVRRLWIELGLRRPFRLRKARKLGPKPGVGANSCTQQPARFKNDVWTCNFIHDRTAGGRPLRWLTLVDEYTLECLVLHAGESLFGGDVRRIVACVIGRRGAPTRIRTDNGSEFICAVLTNWLPGGAKSIPVAAASPWENDYIESFHSRLRDEFLEWVEFETVADARARAAWFRREYNTVRPYSSLGYATPKEYGAACDGRENREQSIIKLHINNYIYLTDSHLGWTKKRRAAHTSLSLPENPRIQGESRCGVSKPRNPHQGKVEMSTLQRTARLTLRNSHMGRLTTAMATIAAEPPFRLLTRFVIKNCWPSVETRVTGTSPPARHTCLA